MESIHLIYNRIYNQIVVNTGYKLFSAVLHEIYCFHNVQRSSYILDAAEYAIQTKSRRGGAASGIETKRKL